MSNNILVTGAAGFIGANFAEYFVNKYPEYNVIVLDKLTYAGNMDNLKKVMDKITFDDNKIIGEAGASLILLSNKEGLYFLSAYYYQYIMRHTYHHLYNLV